MSTAGPEHEAPLEGLVVAHVTTVHDARDTRIRYKECASLVEQGATVYLLAPDADPGGTSTIDSHGIRLVNLQRRPKHWRLLRSGYEALRDVRRIGPDIVHFHDPELLLMAPLFRRTGARVIYDIHEDTPRQLAGREWIWKPLRSVLVRLVERCEPLLGRACDGFVMVEDWKERFPPRPTAIVANLPLRQEFEASTVERQLDPPVIAYLGSITEERGALDLVRAVNKVSSPCRLVLAGPVGDDLATRLRSEDTQGRLELTGYLDRADAVALLKRASIGALLLRPTPAYDVATATKLHEYALAGLPMVLSNTTAHRSYAAEHGCATVVDGQDGAAVGRAFDELLNEDEVRTALVANARRAAAMTATWETEFRPLVDLYRELT